MNTDRREFIKNACGLCTALLGVATVLPVLTSCSSLETIHTSVNTGIVTLPISKFTEENKVIVLKSAHWEFDIAVAKLSESTFRAFYMECTHQSTGLVVTNSGYYCSAHGSSFSKDGKVKTPPATRNLKEFPTELVASELRITV